MTLLISGPMTGIEGFNTPRFNEVAEAWRKAGYDIINPAEYFDRDQSRPRKDYMYCALYSLQSCQGLIVLEGWEKSKGSVFEVIAAIELGLPIFTAKQPVLLAEKRESALLIRDFVAGLLRAAWQRRDSTPRVALGGIARHLWRAEAQKTMAEQRFGPDVPWWYDNHDTSLLGGAEYERPPGLKRPDVDPFIAELEEIKKLQAAKRSDYTADSIDPLSNYRFSAGMVGLDVVSGMVMRLAEKLYRVKSVLEKERQTAVTDEPLTDTFRDIAIIAVLCKLALMPGSLHAEGVAP